MSYAIPSIKPILDRLTAAEASIAGLPFTAEYESPQTAIASAGSATLAHGLGVVPKAVFIEAICVGAEHGYSVGARLSLEAMWPRGSGTSSRRMITTKRDATNISLQCGSSDFFQGILDDGKNTASLTLANWEFVVRAFA